jgi:hypothetical protein
MNELIRKFAVQAGVEDNPDPEGLALFAELIVKECAKEIQLSTNDLSDDYHVGFNTGLVSASKIIKQHFGVEL